MIPEALSEALGTTIVEPKTGRGAVCARFGERLGDPVPVWSGVKGGLYVKLCHLVIVAGALLSPLIVGAAEIPIGLVSFDAFIPGGPDGPGVNIFTIGNLTGDPATGGYAVPPTFPVLSNPARISWTFWREKYMIPSWPTIPDWVQNMLS